MGGRVMSAGAGPGTMGLGTIGEDSGMPDILGIAPGGDIMGMGPGPDIGPGPGTGP